VVRLDEARQVDVRDHVHVVDQNRLAGSEESRGMQNSASGLERSVYFPRHDDLRAVPSEVPGGGVRIRLCVLLQVAYDPVGVMVQVQHDPITARLREAPDCALQQSEATNLHERLGSHVRERPKPCSETCGQNHSVHESLRTPLPG
jgi:hypothetical protein